MIAAGHLAAAADRHEARLGLGREQLREIGAKIEQARGKAPRKPMRPYAVKQTVDTVISWPMSRWPGVSAGLCR